MISSISGTSSYQYGYSVGSTDNSLSDDQKSTLQDILSKYDASSMTDDSTKTMMDEIKEAGIKPSKAFGEIMNAAGFKPPEKPSGPPPDEQASGMNSNSKISEELLAFIKKQESGDISQNDIATLIQTLQNSGQSAQGSLVDQTA
jgi:hypothetical protein